MTLRKLALTGAAIVLGGTAVFAVTPLGRDLLFHVLPVNWTGEATRLGAALGIRPGSAIADIGAGNGALIVELAKLVGPEGAAFATERTPEQRQRITDRATSAGVRVSVVEAADRSTHLPDGCCDAITMRMVMHHIADPETFARDLRRSLRRGGRVGILDFAPGAMPHLTSDHGSDPAGVVAAFTSAGFSVQSRDDRWGGRTFLIVFRAPGN
jgi:SAM-dependent methyltransferase